MRVIEQLVQHFWMRGSITRDEARYLIQHGFIREGELSGFAAERGRPEGEPDSHEIGLGEDDEKARRAEELEAELTGRQGGGKKGGKKKQPTGHNLAPAAAVLASHFAAREPYPALLELAGGLRPRATWTEAARVIGAATPDDLDVALVGLLNARPRALGELWYWFDLEPLFRWAEDKANAGPVAAGLGKLMRVANRNQVGRAGQLMKAAEFRSLADLLDARRAFRGILPRLYDRHFARLGQWLVPPAGPAAACWTTCVLAFIMVYSAKEGTEHDWPAGYEVSVRYEVGQNAISFSELKSALTTAYEIDAESILRVFLHRLRDLPDPLPYQSDWEKRAVFDQPLRCPFNWRV